MTLTLVLAIVGGLVFWAIVGYAIWFWGPGLRKRSVWCPVLKRRAKVLADQREPEFGCLRVVDVKSCSLVKGPELTCSKECLSHL
jgi:hypothetical protein